MYPVHHLIRTFTLLTFCLFVPTAWSALDETYQLTIGTSVSDYDSKIRINSRDDSIDKEIDFEDVLGLDNKVRLSWIKGVWHMGARHTLNLIYLPISRSSSITSSNDIDVGGNVIKAGASFATSVNTHVFDIEYIYSFYQRPDLEIGVTGGLYWMNSLVEVAAAGEIILEGEDLPEFRTDYQANQRLIAPLPLLGIAAIYEINPQWRAKVNARYFDVTIGDIDGRILSLTLGTEYYFTKRLGLGASIASFDLSVQQNGVVFINSLQYEYVGLQAFMVMKF